MFNTMYKNVLDHEYCHWYFVYTICKTSSILFCVNCFFFMHTCTISIWSSSFQRVSPYLPLLPHVGITSLTGAEKHRILFN